MFSVIHDDNSTQIDYTQDAKSFIKDTFSTTLIAAEDYLYVGLYKPFERFYCDFETANTNANDLDVEFWNGSTWTNVSNLVDDTKGFTRSGFVSFDKNTDLWETLASIGGVTRYWLRIKPDADHSATTFNGIGIVFSDDDDLKEEFWEISSFLPTGESSFIAKHQSARNDIVQEIRNRGSFKKASGQQSQHITEFDFINPVEEIKQASKYLALHKIFNNISDDTEGKLFQLSEYYKEKFKSAFSIYFLSLDVDDDGKNDTVEVLNVRRVKVNRV